jgi:hypothetical protein
MRLNFWRQIDHFAVECVFRLCTLVTTPNLQRGGRTDRSAHQFSAFQPSLNDSHLNTPIIRFECVNSSRCPIGTHGLQRFVGRRIVTAGGACYLSAAILEMDSDEASFDAISMKFAFS